MYCDRKGEIQYSLVADGKVLLNRGFQENPLISGVLGVYEVTAF